MIKIRHNKIKIFFQNFFVSHGILRSMKQYLKLILLLFNIIYLLSFFVGYIWQCSGLFLEAEMRDHDWGTTWVPGTKQGSVVFECTPLIVQSLDPDSDFQCSKHMFEFEKEIWLIYIPLRKIYKYNGQ